MRQTEKQTNTLSASRHPLFSLFSFSFSILFISFTFDLILSLSLSEAKTGAVGEKRVTFGKVGISWYPTLVFLFFFFFCLETNKSSDSFPQGLACQPLRSTKVIKINQSKTYFENFYTRP